MLTGLFLGAAGSGDCFAHGNDSADDGVDVLPRLVSNRIAPGGMAADVLVKSVTVDISANASASFTLIPIVDDVRYDGVLAPDCSVDFTVTGDGLSQMPMSQRVFLAIGLTVTDSAGVAIGTQGLRGEWFQYEIIGTAPVGLDAEGELGTVFLEGLSMDFVVLRSSEYPTAPAGGTTPTTKTPGYTSTPAW